MSLFFVTFFSFPCRETGSKRVFVLKVKVVLSLCSGHHAVKAYWGVEVELHAFFDLGTRWK
jgi:hypothetical protein